ncbi:MAG: hypothetical protein NC240_11685 [Clostridium sp.]|nr:hypothetical protein [Clostridium sp.]
MRNKKLIPVIMLFFIMFLSSCTAVTGKSDAGKTGLEGDSNTEITTDDNATQTLQTAEVTNNNNTSDTLQSAGSTTSNQATQTSQTAEVTNNNNTSDTLQSAGSTTSNHATQTTQMAGSIAGNFVSQTVQTAEDTTDNNTSQSTGSTNSNNISQPTGSTTNNHTSQSTGSANSNNTSQTPSTTEQQAGENQENGNGAYTSIHQHTWEAQYRTVHHDEVGHYETVCVKKAWDEPVYETHNFCNYCGIDITATGVGLGHCTVCGPPYPPEHPLYGQFET